MPDSSPPSWNARRIASAVGSSMTNMTPSLGSDAEAGKAGTQIPRARRKLVAPICEARAFPVAQVINVAERDGRAPLAIRAPQHQNPFAKGRSPPLPAAGSLDHHDAATGAAAAGALFAPA